MKNRVSQEIHFAAVGAEHVCAIRPGVSGETALSFASEALDVAHGLMLLASEMESQHAQAAATWLVETAQAALQAIQQ